MSLIEVRDLVYSYDGKKNAVDGVSFAIEKGKYTAVIGHNGSGKSTLAKLLAGLLEAKEGEITIEGLRLDLENVRQIREKLGIVFQNPDNQFIGSTVRDDIAFGLENHLVPSGQMDDIINEYSAKVGLSTFLDKEPQNLSGGQKQRVAIAGILAMKPEILIFDEATSMLDPKGKSEIRKLMSELNDDDRFTIISITHDIEEVLQADECLVLNRGKLYMQGTPDEVFSHPQELRKIGLDIPFNARVKEEFRRNKINLKSDDWKGMVEEICRYRSGR